MNIEVPLYWYIVLNAHYLEDKDLYPLLDDLDIQCLARNIKQKFNDKRPLSSIIKLIVEELGSASLFPKTCVKRIPPLQAEFGRI